MRSEVAAALEQEQKAQEYLAQLKAQVADEVLSAGPMEGVTPIEGTVRCCTVKASALIKGLNMSPSTYIPECQAEAVARKLAPKKTVQDVITAVQEMADTGVAKFAAAGDTVTLNDKTVDALKGVLN